MPNDAFPLSRRTFVAGSLLAGAALSVPRLAYGLDVDGARALIDKAIGAVNDTINSGKSEQAMYGDLERIFLTYADVPTIARSALGPTARTASKAQLSAFTKAFQGYISRKYGRRFREFVGGRIEVQDAREVKSYVEVVTTAYLQGEAPFEVRFHVSDKAGKSLFFNIIIEGVNMLASERTEIGALLDQRGGDLDKLIADMASL